MRLNELNKGIDKKKQKKLDEVNLGQVGAALGNAKETVKQGIANTGQNIKSGIEDFQSNSKHSTVMQQQKNHNVQTAKQSIDKEASLTYKTIKDKEKQLIQTIKQFSKFIIKTDSSSYNKVKEIQNQFKLELNQYKSFKPKPTTESILETLIFEVNKQTNINQDLIKYFDQILEIMDNANSGDKNVVSQLKPIYDKIIGISTNSEDNNTENSNEPNLKPKSWNEASALMQDIINHEDLKPTQDPEYFKKLADGKITPEYLEKWRSFIEYSPGTTAREEAEKRIDDAKLVLTGGDVDKAETGNDIPIDPDDADQIKNAKSYSNKIKIKDEFLSDKDIEDLYNSFITESLNESSVPEEFITWLQDAASGSGNTIDKSQFLNLIKRGKTSYLKDIEKNKPGLFKTIQNNKKQDNGDDDETMELKKFTSPFKQSASILMDKIEKNDPDNSIIQKLTKKTAIALKKDGNVSSQVITALKSPEGIKIFKALLGTVAGSREVKQTLEMKSLDFMLFGDQVIKEAIKQSKTMIL